jgi:multicomponent K+:H+ antiporter subunit E
MSRLVPAPLVSAALFVLWLALDAPPGPVDVVIGAIVALVVPVVVAPLRPQRFRVRRPGRVVRYALVVLGDALASNYQVARAMIRPRAALPEGRFVRIPLDLDDPGALATLAVVTTTVPGTVWCELASDRRSLLLHVLECDDEAAFVAHFKARYEGPLKEIFR